MKLAIIGSRQFSCKEKMREVVSEFLKINPVEEIVSGGAKGADSFGAEIASEKNIPVRIFYPDWKQFGRAAGPIRNSSIVETSDVCLAFIGKPLESSKGTSDSVRKFIKAGKPVHIFYFDKGGENE